MTSGDCQSCSIFEVCPSLGDKPVKEDQRVLLPLSDETIREIAAVHPRFAATLARIRNVPVSSGTHQVYWTPVGFTAKDVERYITPQDQSKALSQSQQEAVRRANLEVEEGKLTNISYLVTVNALDASSGRLILEVTSGSYLDPAYSGLELRYTNDKVEWRVF
jgi:hypothetical protein